MSQQKLLAKVLSVLGPLGIDYMLTGSLASTMQGEPRSTHDVDLVVSLRPESAEDLAQAFPPPDYYLDRQSILDAIQHGSMFNLLNVEEYLQRVRSEAMPP